MEKFDVLSVMDRCEAREKGRAVPLKASEIEDARAAVADLIEKAAAVLAAHRELPSRDHPAEVRQAGEDRIGRAHYALDAALAHIGGA